MLNSETCSQNCLVMIDIDLVGDQWIDKWTDNCEWESGWY